MKATQKPDGKLILHLKTNLLSSEGGVVKNGKEYSGATDKALLERVNGIMGQKAPLTVSGDPGKSKILNITPFPGSKKS